MRIAAGQIRQSSSGRPGLIASAIGGVWRLAANIVAFSVCLRLLEPEHFGVVALLAAITATGGAAMCKRLCDKSLRELRGVPARYTSCDDPNHI